jgi:hypothetical protein
MLHQEVLVRTTASEVFFVAVLLSASEVNGAGSAEMEASCVEQGIVPQLEYIAQGQPVRNRANAQGGDALYPEKQIREVAQYALNSVASGLVKSEAARSRVLNAMLHSGNTKLRQNIFSGLVYAVGRSVGDGDGPLGRYGDDDDCFQIFFILRQVAVDVQE